MKKLFAAAAATIILAPAAHAADAVVYDPAPVMADAYSWSGAYIGLHLGYIRGTQRDDMPLPPGGGKPALPQRPVDSKSGAAAGGFHAGYNWQRGAFVYGIEGDIDYTGLERAKNFYTQVGIINPSGSLFMESDWQASLRLRAGYAIDTWLFYGTGGIAFAHADVSAVGNPNPVAYPLVSDSNTHIGWTAGAGVEKAFTANWIGRVEARYTDFGSKTYNLGAFGDDVKSRWKQTVVNVGLSYKF